MALGMSLWLAYGVLTAAPAVVITNVATLLLLAGLAILKARTAESIEELVVALEPAA